MAMAGDVQYFTEERDFKIDAGQGTLEWLNKLVEIAWPQVVAYVQDLLMGSVTQTIRDSLPRPLKGLGFTTVLLGETVPRFGPIRSYERNAGEVKVDLVVDYQSEVELKIGGVAEVELTVSHITFVGTVSLVLAPLVPVPPFFGGMTVFFTNPPDIQVTFSGLCNLVSFPGVPGLIRRGINTAVAGACVIPNTVSFALADHESVDESMRNSPRPVGLLRLSVVRATSLVNKDWSLTGKNKSDPYVLVQLGGERWQSPTISDNLNPEWPAPGNCQDYLVFAREQLLNIQLFDEDLGGQSDSLGRVVPFPLARIFEEGPELTLPLTGDGDVNSGSSVTIRGEWLDLRFGPCDGVEATAGPSQLVVGIAIREVTGLGVDAAYPFIVKARLAAGDSDKGAQEKETLPSVPFARQYAVAARLQKIVKKLNSKGMTTEDIADVTDLHEVAVKEFLEGTAADSKNVQASADRAATLPQFKKILYFLVPSEGPEARAWTLHLELQDKKQRSLGSTDISVGDVLDAESGMLNGPWELAEGVQLEGYVLYALPVTEA